MRDPPCRCINFELRLSKSQRRAIKLSKYRITFLIEFTKSLGVAFNNVDAERELLKFYRAPGYPAINHEFLFQPTDEDADNEDFHVVGRREREGRGKGGREKGCTGG